MKNKLWSYQVTGTGHFPVDMLRVDSCWPQHPVDALLIHSSIEKPDNYCIKLKSIHPPTFERWETVHWNISNVRPE